MLGIRRVLHCIAGILAAQVDLVNLKAEDVEWKTRTITYNRQKTGRLCVLRFADAVAEILQRLPVSGKLFPKYSTISSADRATMRGFPRSRLPPMPPPV